VGCANRFVLIYSLLAFQTALRGPLIKSGHLFDLFPKRCNYLSAVLVWFESTVRKPTPFSLLRLSTSSFWILLCNLFSYSIMKEKINK
jgi:hypothetical protein